jgi:integrase
VNPVGSEDDVAALLKSCEPGIAVDVENAGEVFEVRAGLSLLRSGANTKTAAGGAGPLHGRWSRAYTYDGKVIRLRQSKSMRKGGRRPVNVTVPVGAPLMEALDAAARRKRSTVILTTMEGAPWTSDGFRASWGKAIKKAGVIGVTFNDLRGTAVTRLALVGCTEAEIAAITGHSLRDVRSILDAHYLHRDPELARKAIHKLEMDYAQRSQRPEPEQTLQNDFQNGLDVLPGTEEKAL